MSTSTLQQLTKPKLTNNTQDLDKSGIYKLTCNNYQMSYTGQTNRNLKQRYQEHERNNGPQSAYAHHILSNQYKYGAINNTMTLLEHINEASLLIPYEQLYIQTYHQNGHLIPE